MILISCNSKAMSGLQGWLYFPQDEACINTPHACLKNNFYRGQITSLTNLDSYE